MHSKCARSYPCFDNPYPMDIHEAPVACCSLLVDVPCELTGFLYQVGLKQKRTECSTKVNHSSM